MNPPDTILVGDTVPVTIEALNRSGDLIPDAPVYLVSLRDTVVAIADSVNVVGLPIGALTADTASVVARVGNLATFPFRIVVRVP